MYLTDPAAALAELKTDSLDRDYVALRRWSPVPTIDYEAFLASHSTFRVYDFGNGWLMKRLQQRGASFRTIGNDADAVLYDVTLEP